MMDELGDDGAQIRCLVLVCHERMAKAIRCCIKDEGRPLGIALKEGISNHPLLLG